jgi:hypothetical protein
VASVFWPGLRKDFLYGFKAPRSARRAAGRSPRRGRHTNGGAETPAMVPGLLNYKKQPHTRFGVPRLRRGGAGLPPARAPPPVFAPAGASPSSTAPTRGRKLRPGRRRTRSRLHTRAAKEGAEGRRQDPPRRGWGGRLRGFTHLPGPEPASSKTGGPLGHIAARSKTCPRSRASLRPPDHARPQTRQDTGQNRGAASAARYPPVSAAARAKRALPSCTWQRQG